MVDCRDRISILFCVSPLRPGRCILLVCKELHFPGSGPDRLACRRAHHSLKPSTQEIDQLQGDSMRARIILMFVLLAAVSLSAQTFRGTILGTVTDAQGAVLSGAKVAVKNAGTGLERDTDTSADGSYALPELPIGTYTVTISQAGFQTSVVTGVTVDVASERRVDA